jgi:vesicle-associated membrane protein 7
MASSQLLLYSLVSRHGGSGTRPLVLSEFSATTGNFQTVARRILEKVPNKDTKATYTYEQHVFHVMVDSGLIFMVMMKQNPDMKKRTPFAFLDDVKKSFTKQFGANLMTVTPNDVFEVFAPTLNEKMQFYSKEGSDAQVGQVRDQIEEVKGIMVENVDKILERGEKLSLLVDKTDDLNMESVTFKKQAVELKRKMWWKNMKMTLLIALPVLVGTFFLIMYPSCSSIHVASYLSVRQRTAKESKSFSDSCAQSSHPSHPMNSFDYSILAAFFIFYFNDSMSAAMFIVPMLPKSISCKCGGYAIKGHNLLVSSETVLQCSPWAD